MSKYTPIPVNPIGNYTTTSQLFSMSNYQTVNFFVETKKDGAEITFKVEASKDGANPENIGFQFIENGGQVFEDISPEGKTVVHSGDGVRTWQITVNDCMLSHGEYDSIALVVTENDTGAVTSIFALQTQPRYSENE